MSSNKETSLSLARPGMDAKKIPSRFSLSAYQRYEEHIKSYMAAWPHPVDFQPQDIAIETFAKGLRNAIQSALAFQWPSADIDIPYLATIWPATVVSQYPSGVRIGPRDTPRAPALGQTSIAHSFDLETSDTLAVKAAIVLLSRGKLTAPVLLKGDPEVALSYIAQNEYDVSLRPAPEAGPEAYLML